MFFTFLHILFPSAAVFSFCLFMCFFDSPVFAIRFYSVMLAPNFIRVKSACLCRLPTSSCLRPAISYPRVVQASARTVQYVVSLFCLSHLLFQQSIDSYVTSVSTGLHRPSKSLPLPVAVCLPCRRCLSSRINVSTFHDYPRSFRPFLKRGTSFRLTFVKYFER